jgi:4-amino-4-deoxy-L-arabinose transferase-like glycosyltransferase
LLVLAVLRLPSFMEPHWYTDEAGYLNVARELLQGKVLYSQTWNNKPPLMLWTIALDVKLFASSEIALHLLTLISGAVAVTAIVWAATRLYTPRRALIAGVIAAVILGTPLVDAEQAIRVTIRAGFRAGRWRWVCSWLPRSPTSRPPWPRPRHSSWRC